MAVPVAHAQRTGRLVRRYPALYRLLIKDNKPETGLFLLMALLLTLLQAPLPYLSGYMIDTVLPSGEPSLLLQVALLIAALYAGYLVMEYLNDRLRLRVRREIMVRLNQGAIQGILGMSHNERLRVNNGDLVSRLTRDMDQLEVIMPYGLTSAVHQLLLSVVLLLIVFVLNWQLSTMLLLLVPAAILVYLKFDSALWSSSRAETEASGRKLAVIQETIEADVEVKAYEAGPFFTTHTGRGVRAFEESRYVRELYDIKVSMIIMGMPMLAIVAIWYLGGRMVMAGDLSLGLIVTYTATLALMVPALIRLVTFVSSLPNELTALNRVADLFVVPAGPSQVDGTSPILHRDSLPDVGSLAVEGMSFSYSEQYPLFSSLDLAFDRGGAHLINGGNGAGKSTLLTILSGAVTPREGSVRLDGKDLAGFPDKSRWITYVPQRIRIISDSVRNNVTFGAAFDAADVESVLERVGLGDWVARLDGGIDYMIRDASAELSGGQVQKIGLARALLRDTPILLMDEPTNNLDSQAVALLLATIRRYKRDRIVVIVSHDDRIFDAVDRVVYLENDSVTESTRVTVTLPDSCPRFIDEAK